MQSLEPNEVLAGKYRVESVLGSGGMGIVVKATHLLLAQSVAVKVLKPAALAHPGMVARFAREARALARLRSEHVARVLDVGTLENGAPYLVMEYLEGNDLAEVLVQRGRLPLAEAANLLLQACEGIAEAHASRIVHRDLKPANIFLARQRDGIPIVKVLDFGIAKALDEGDALTQTSTGLGSLHYMAPEQMRNAKECDARADLWALGVILYELVTGALPFAGTSPVDVFAAAMLQQREPVREHLPDAPAALQSVVDRCLESEPHRRLSSVAELAAELAAFCGTAESTSRVEKIQRLLASGTEANGTPAAGPSTAKVVDRPSDGSSPEQAYPAVHKLGAEGDWEGASALALAELGPEIFGFLTALHPPPGDARLVFEKFSERLSRRLPTFDWTCSLRTWAYKQARQTSLDFRPGTEPTVELEGGVSRVIGQVLRATGVVHSPEVDSNRAALTPDERVLILLRVDKKLTWDELVVVLHDDVPPDEQARAAAVATLKSQFRIAKDKLVAVAATMGIVRPNRT